MPKYFLTIIILAHNISPLYHKTRLQMQNIMGPRKSLNYLVSEIKSNLRPKNFILSKYSKKPMIQIHGNTILSNGIQPHDQSA